MNAPESPEEARPTFDALPLSADIRRAVDRLGYVHPTPVQLAVFDAATRGKSLVVQARTGTGKTAAFGLPIVDSLVKKSVEHVQALILTPTRELALQVGRELEKLGQERGTRVVAIYGGASMEKQVAELQAGGQIVAGTPGRVLDHLRRGTLDPSGIKIFVLDEADEMLSMGFAKELHSIVEFLPKDRQGLYFSATIPPDIERLANRQLTDPEYITLSSDHIGALEVAHYAYVVPGGADKRAELVRILEVENPESAILFCNTKDETERLAEYLTNRGYDADWLNGDLDQKERERVMTKTREGRLRFLVATDVAARGIDVSHLTHVINADFPENPENYVHRTGRTGRAGKTGVAISLIGPKDIGGLYLLKLTYKLRPIEKALPSMGEMKTRAEADLLQFFVDAYGTNEVAPDDMSLARRLLTHAEAERIVASLLREHLGGRAITKELAAEARRSKNPAPIVEAAPAPTPRTLRDGESKGPRAEAPRRERSGRSDREGRGERDRGDRPARIEQAPTKTSSDGEPIIAAPVDARPRDRERPRRDRDRPRAEPRSGGGTTTLVSETGLPGFSVEGEGLKTRHPPEHSPQDRAVDDERDDEPQLYLNVGRRDGLEPETVFEFVSEEGGIARERLGRVRLRDRMTYVSVPTDAIESLVARLTGKELAGRTVVCELARKT